jgi:hypothetical protein
MREFLKPLVIVPTDRRSLGLQRRFRLMEETVEEPERQVGAMVGSCKLLEKEK